MTTTFEAELKRKIDSNSMREYYLEVLKTFPQNEWFSANNADGKNDYSILSHLWQLGMVCHKWIPEKNGGCKVFWLWNEDLNYQNA